MSSKDAGEVSPRQTPPQPAKEAAPGTGGGDPAAHERGSLPKEGKAAPGMEEMMVLLRQLTTKVNMLEKAVTPRGAPVSPDQPLRRSVFRQAIEEGGSLGMQQMHVDELGGGHVGLGVQTPGGWARAGYLDHEVDRGVPPYQAYRPPPVQAQAQQQPLQLHAEPVMATEPRAPPYKRGEASNTLPSRKVG
ncbi:unnamed protein product [Phytophthora fragariaefolia]|uniref:Unnamed protein product n=1 Tax=Phytophthora fragariaefolia TaxID=1490495 RepID=A0A9W6TT05_9STRA|nr:unnamed protein product [Phytophthora fragariaefolia]